jgi:MFS family permease
MTEILRKKLSDSKGARWAALLIVSFTMMMGYFLTDVMSPLEDMLETSLPHGGLGWTSAEYGFFSGSYGLINVYLLMLFFGGIILDKMGIRFTGIMSCALMVIGGFIKYYAIAYMTNSGSVHVNLPMFGLTDMMVKNQVLMASLGFSIFGVGCEITGITVSKIITKWFNGHELALAMGIQVALARLGTAAAIGLSATIAKSYAISTPIIFAAIMLCIGLVVYIVYCIMDKKLDNSTDAMRSIDDEDEESFKFKDLLLIFKNPGFWIITLLCLLFYSGVFPFLKFATKLMICKYHIGMMTFALFGHVIKFDAAGLIPALLPFGTILLTPLFGSIYDRVGKGATLMIIGSVMLTIVHIAFALPVLNTAWFAIIIMIILGIAFSLVPSAMWPSVPKIIPMKQLGSAYAIIFYIQNIGLTMVPMLIGNILENHSKQVLPNGVVKYDFTMPMIIFAIFGVAAIILAILLKVLDAKKHYGLELPNAKV